MASSSYAADGGVDDPSLALALALQSADDAELARQMMADEEERERQHRRGQQVAAPATASQQQHHGPLPGERLAAAAHKSIQHLGKNTCKKLESHFLKNKQTMTLAELLKIFRSARREEMLMLVDAGQRQRIEAELVAADLDFPAAS